MIFSTLNQLNCFILFLFCGLIFGIFYLIFSVLFLKKYQKIFQKIIFEGIFYTFFAIFYVFFINFYNFGKISLVLIFAYILGFLWTNKLGKNLVVNLENKWYNHLKSKRDNNGRKHTKRNKKATLK